MERPPSKIKKDLVELRGKLKRSEAKQKEAEAELQKRREAGASSLSWYDIDNDVRTTKLEVARLKNAIKVAEEELVGDWKPKSWEAQGR